MNSKLLISIDPTSVEPEHGAPAPDRLISGQPKHTTWNMEDKDGLYCGIWQSTPGKWRVSYDEWEYCLILEGVSILTEDGAAPVTVRAGDRFMLRPGFKGTWEVIETTRKDYVIKL